MTGYKLFPKEITKLGELDVANFGFEIEATARILKMGYRVVEVPIHYSARRAGKKITWADGLLSVYYLFKYRFRLKAPRLQFVADLLLKYFATQNSSSCKGIPAAKRNPRSTVHSAVNSVRRAWIPK